MPRYEYACRDCGEHVEVVQSFRDAPLTTCGVCGGGIRKVFSAAGIIFKGSGYYVTDSRGNGERRKGAGREGSETKKAGDGAGKSDGAGKPDGGGSGDSAGAPARAESA